MKITSRTGGGVTLPELVTSSLARANESALADDVMAAGANQVAVTHAPKYNHKSSVFPRDEGFNLTIKGKLDMGGKMEENKSKKKCTAN